MPRSTDEPVKKISVHIYVRQVDWINKQSRGFNSSKLFRELLDAHILKEDEKK